MSQDINTKRYQNQKYEHIKNINTTKKNHQQIFIQQDNKNTNTRNIHAETTAKTKLIFTNNYQSKHK